MQNVWNEHDAIDGIDAVCLHVRACFDDYLDGTTTGVEMASIATHLEECAPCALEFEELRNMQQALAAAAPVRVPERLQQDLRNALSLERTRGTHLPLRKQLALAWDRQLAPLALRLAGGLSATIVLLGSAVSVLGLSNAVLADDDNMAHLVQPRYLYSQVPQSPVETRHDVPVIVDAMVDTHGRVYDYSIVAGPRDQDTSVQIERNLLTSVFQPATLFGVPVKGHVVVTFSGISVRG
ncbi:anti-sigma factor family protein [Bryocella elongata]|uniref:anti-sigma factor family protein n=1 Tax=Bryocella elongata TaxID=863522 RepID=UPI0013575277|nr:anti-sigma factor [Bryocella elongata]